MKKTLISLLLSSCTFVITPSVLANNSFSSAQIAQVQIASLSFKNIMRQFYSGQMHSTFVDGEAINQMPHIALGLADKDGDTTVAVMHPTIEYYNQNSESRYLVVIEKIKVMSNGGIVSCHACSADADIYSFKQTANNQFQLVSRSAKNTEFSASWGRINLNLEELGQNIRALGKNLVGSVFQNGYSSTGETESWWETLHLPENDYIRSYVIADAGADNSGNYDEDSPLHYSYEGTLDIIDNGAEFFPIKITYTGEKPSENYERISPINYSKVVQFNSQKKKYN